LILTVSDDTLTVPRWQRVWTLEQTNVVTMCTCLPPDYKCIYSVVWESQGNFTAMFSEAQNIARSLLVELAYSLTCYLKKQVDFPDPLI